MRIELYFWKKNTKSVDGCIEIEGLICNCMRVFCNNIWVLRVKLYLKKNTKSYWCMHWTRHSPLGGPCNWIRWKKNWLCHVIWLVSTSSFTLYGACSRWTSYASPTSLFFSFLGTCVLPSTIFKSTFQVIFPFDFVPHFDFYLFYFYSFLFFFFSIGSSFNFFSIKFDPFFNFFFYLR